MKKNQNGMHLTKNQLFWRIQKECWRRMVTPYLMYLFMSLLMLATQAISGNSLVWLKITLGILCLLGGMAFNAHLTYNYGIIHYDAYLTGCVHRKNLAYGIESGGDHRPEREYRPWKGFYIGFLIGVPVIILGIIAAATSVASNLWGVAGIALIMFAGWAIIPVSWIRDFAGIANINFGWSILMVVIPIVVSGVFYIVGAMREKKKKEAQAARDEAVKKLQEEQAALRQEQKMNRIQTEEQRRKTLQSKKKKK